MTDLELPQVSFARYLELLKRRWWQVIPVTLFGLIAGAIAAFLIPRYYVAKTLFVYNGGAALDPNAQDPMLAYVTNARLSIPPLAEQVMLELGWPEATDENEDRRQGFVTGIEGEIVVGTPAQMLAHNQLNLEISYRDTNGQRSADMANALRDAWTEAERARIDEVAFKEVSQANTEERRLVDLKSQAEAELRNHRVQHRIVESDPVGRDDRVKISNPYSFERAELQTRLSVTQSDIAGIQGEIDNLHSELSSGTMRPTIVKHLEIPPDPEVEARYQLLIKSVRTANEKLGNLQPTHSNYPLAKLQVEVLEKQLQDVAEERNKSRVVVEDNPHYQAAQARITELRSSLEGKRKTESTDVERIAKLDEKLDEWPQILSRHEKLMHDVDSLRERLETVTAENRATRRKYDQLQIIQPFRVIQRAQVPPRPTDPNIFLVAILGSLIGLASAIGLILLLDFLQSSFKTLDDVERALPVPVLGSLAHLETYEERTRSVATRRRYSLAASVFLFLSLSVVTIYFVDPTKLPPVVMNVLDMILGTSPEPK